MMPEILQLTQAINSLTQAGQSIFLGTQLALLAPNLAVLPAGQISIIDSKLEVPVLIQMLPVNSKKCNPDPVSYNLNGITFQDSENTAINKMQVTSYLGDLLTLIQIAKPNSTRKKVLIPASMRTRVKHVIEIKEFNPDGKLKFISIATFFVNLNLTLKNPIGQVNSTLSINIDVCPDKKSFKDLPGKLNVGLLLKGPNGLTSPRSAESTVNLNLMKLKTSENPGGRDFLSATIRNPFDLNNFPTSGNGNTFSSGVVFDRK